jgi:putative pyruvate formate lyase activating enzyme
MPASYLRLANSGELMRRAETLERMLASCDICPLDCKVDRLNGEMARCYSRALPIVSSYCPHFGEEPALVGTRGVGNIFLGNCNLRCVYCQNYQISQNHKGELANEVTHERLAAMMLELQNVHHVHAIGLVSPTHFVPQIVRALSIAAAKGLHLPIIYNTNCYDSVDVLKLLDGIVDIYLPDFKYASNEAGVTYSRVEDYFTHASKALIEMHRQVGSSLGYNAEGIIERGLIIRHLILANDIAGTEGVFDFISKNLGTHVTISVMAQYYPTNKVTLPSADAQEALLLIQRKIRPREYDRALELFERFGFENGWVQEFDAENYYRPDFTDRAEPFRDRRDFVRG